jgi:hypothetical protein
MLPSSVALVGSQTPRINNWVTVFDKRRESIGR